MSARPALGAFLALAAFALVACEGTRQETAPDVAAVSPPVVPAPLRRAPAVIQRVPGDEAAMARNACLVAPARLVVHVLDREAGIDLATGSATLTQRGGGDGYHALGLYSAIRQTQVEVQVMRLTQTPSQRTCLGVSQIDVSISFRERQIFIAREAQGSGPCHERVMHHEQGHRAIDDGLLAEAEGWFRAGLEATLRTLHTPTPVPGARAAATIEAFQAAALRAVDAVRQQFEAENRRRQAAHDSPEEYADITKYCRGVRIVG